MVLTMASSVISQDREEELVHILHRVFRNRCGFEELQFSLVYEERGKSRALRDSELLIQETARQVAVQALARREETSPAVEVEEEPKQVQEKTKEGTQKRERQERRRISRKKKKGRRRKSSGAA